MDPARAARALENWFRRNARDLPWRRTYDPYQVLVAEFILQQTRMETGLRYYERFLRRFPTIYALARARPEAVRGVWSGLGYYSRARNLHATAQTIVREHDGRVPGDAALLESLPGIGPYTAGAIASIAYDRPVPAIDGNQARVLGRALGLRFVASASGRRRLAAWSLAMLRAGSPRVLNQAVMDLGRSVCRSRSPACAQCPLRADCRWTKRRAPTRTLPRRRPVVENWVAVVHVRAGRVWLAAPRVKGLLAGTWLPPLRPARTVLHPHLVHRFSHRVWTLDLQVARAPPRGPGRWVRWDDLRRLPHSSLTRAFVRRALSGSTGVSVPRSTPLRRAARSTIPA